MGHTGSAVPSPAGTLMARPPYLASPSPFFPSRCDRCSCYTRKCEGHQVPRVFQVCSDFRLSCVCVMHAVWGFSLLSSLYFLYMFYYFMLFFTFPGISLYFWSETPVSLLLKPSQQWVRFEGLSEYQTETIPVRKGSPRLPLPPEETVVPLARGPWPTMAIQFSPALCVYRHHLSLLAECRVPVWCDRAPSTAIQKLREAPRLPQCGRLWEMEAQRWDLEQLAVQWGAKSTSSSREP